MQGSLTMGGMAAARCFSCFRSSGFWGEVLARGSPAGVRRLGLGDSSLGRDKRQVRLEHQPQALGGPSWEKGLSCLHGFSFESWKVGPASEALSRGPGAPSAYTAGQQRSSGPHTPLFQWGLGAKRQLKNPNGRPGHRGPQGVARRTQTQPDQGGGTLRDSLEIILVSNPEQAGPWEGD